MKLLVAGALATAVVAIPGGVALGVLTASHGPTAPHAALPAPVPVVPSAPTEVTSPTPPPSPLAPPSPPPTVRVSTPVADGEVLGVGAVVDLRFDRALSTAEQTAVEQSLRVRTVPATTAAWHWVQPGEVHLRPRHTWAVGTTIDLDADLTALTFADGQHGRHLTWHATVGRSRKVVADLRSHLMTVTDTRADGSKAVRTVRFSGGNATHPTRGGVFVVMTRQAHVRMDSATVGIPRSAADGYLIDVDDAVRLTDSGTFVHAAPWSVRSQGRANVSHGCLNVSPADARWFRTSSLLGDLVTVTHSTAAFNPADHGSADWSPSWAQVLATSRTGELTTT